MKIDFERASIFDDSNLKLHFKQLLLAIEVEMEIKGHLFRKNINFYRETLTNDVER